MKPIVGVQRTGTFIPLATIPRTSTVSSWPALRNVNVTPPTRTAQQDNTRTTQHSIPIGTLNNPVFSSASMASSSADLNAPARNVPYSSREALVDGSDQNNNVRVGGIGRRDVTMATISTMDGISGEPPAYRHPCAFDSGVIANQQPPFVAPPNADARPVAPSSPPPQYLRQEDDELTCCCHEDVPCCLCFSKKELKVWELDLSMVNNPPAMETEVWQVSLSSFVLTLVSSVYLPNTSARASANTI